MDRIRLYDTYGDNWYHTEKSDGFFDVDFFIKHLLKS
jgi:hypothetical protein